MKRSHALLALVLAAAAGAVLIFVPRNGDPGDSGALPEKVEVQTGPGGGIEIEGKPGKVSNPAQREVSAGEEGSGEAEDSGYRKALGGLRGRIVREKDRSPVAGIAVEAVEVWGTPFGLRLEEVLEGGSLRNPLEFKARVRTDADGRFEMIGLHSRAILVLAIGLGTDEAAFRIVDRSPSPGRVTDLGEIVLVERGILKGRIVDGEGKGLRGVRVRVLDLPRIVMNFGLSAWDPEGMILETNSGVVGGSGGRTLFPIPAWLAKLDAVLPFGEGRTGPDGRFEVRGIRPGPSTLLCTLPGYGRLTRTTRIRAGRTKDLGDLRMPEGEVLEGRILDADGEGVEGAECAAGAELPVGGLAMLGRPVQSGASGDFRIAGLRKGRLWLALRKFEGAAWEVFGPYRGGDPVEIRLARLRTGLVIVRGPGGRPLGGARLRIERKMRLSGLPGEGDLLPASLHLEERELGRWEVKDLPPGVYRVTAGKDGFAFASGELELPEKGKGKPCLLDLRKALRCRFEVREEGGAAVGGARILWAQEEMWTPMPVTLGRTDSEGLLEVSGPPRGKARFLVRHPGYAIETLEAVVTEGTVVRFRLRALGNLEGVVVKNGAPPEPTSILAEPVGRFSRDFDGLVMPRLAVSDARGNFRFAGLQPGSWKARPFFPLHTIRSPRDFLKLEGMMRASVRVGVEIPSGGTARVRLELAEGRPVGFGVIAGTLRIGGEPGAGYYIRLRGREFLKTRTDAAGAFRFDGLPSGTYTLAVRSSDEEGPVPTSLYERRFELKGQEVIQVPIQLHLGSALVRVRDSKGGALAGVQVRLRKEPDSNGARAWAFGVTGDRGTFLFEGLPSGRWKTGANPPRGFELLLPNRSFRLAPGDRVEVEIRPRPGCRVRGFLRLDLSGLKPKERAFAEKNPPTYLGFESEDFRKGTAVDSSKSPLGFVLDSVLPGDYRVTAFSRAGLWGGRLSVGPRGGEGIELVLKPDPGSLAKALDSKKRKARK